MNKITLRPCPACFGFGWEAVDFRGGIYTRICQTCMGQGSIKDGSIEDVTEEGEE